MLRHRQSKNEEYEDQLLFSEARIGEMALEIDDLQKQLESKIEGSAVSAKTCAELQGLVEKKMQEAEVAEQVAASKEESLRIGVADLENNLQPSEPVAAEMMKR